MYFVHKQNVIGFQVGQQRREIACPFQHRARGLPQVHAHLIGNNMRQRGFTQTRWTEYQHMIECFRTLACRLNKNFHLLTYGRLSGILLKPFGAYGTVNCLVIGGTVFGADQSVSHMSRTSTLICKD